MNRSENITIKYVLDTFNCNKSNNFGQIFDDFKKYYDFKENLLKVGVKFSELNIFLLLGSRKSRWDTVHFIGLTSTVCCTGFELVCFLKLSYI